MRFDGLTLALVITVGVLALAWWSERRRANDAEHRELLQYNTARRLERDLRHATDARRMWQRIADERRASWWNRDREEVS